PRSCSPRPSGNYRPHRAYMLHPPAFSSPSRARVSRNSAMTRRSPAPHFFGAALLATLGLLASCGTPPKPEPKPEPPPVVVAPPKPVPPPENLPPVMLGIDVLEADGFKAIAGKKLGLLTHAAGVNRRGETTISVLRRAPQSKLVCLFAPENGLEGTTKSATKFDDAIHGPTGLPVYSLYGKNKRPTP